MAPLSCCFQVREQSRKANICARAVIYNILIVGYSFDCGTYARGCNRSSSRTTGRRKSAHRCRRAWISDIVKRSFHSSSSIGLRAMMLLSLLDWPIGNTGKLMSLTERGGRFYKALNFRFNNLISRLHGESHLFALESHLCKWDREIDRYRERKFAFVFLADARLDVFAEAKRHVNTNEKERRG